MCYDLLDDGYCRDEVSDVWTRQGFFGITYSDGEEIENRIYCIINNATDLSVFSHELRDHCTDWPTLYHLSANRANILRPFENILREARVLEVGAGCGAITRYLGDSGAKVLALEGSLRRAKIARLRTRDLSNVAVICESFEQFKCNQQFDVVSLVGVLEYANLFIGGKNPAAVMLERVRSFLKPNGKLIIAIENQLGLKYFAGAPEDHVGIPMYGIEARYRNDQPKTYGRKELSGLIHKAGFAFTEFFAPFPDYKLPVSIITERGFSCDTFDAAAMAWQSVRRDPQLPPIMAFSPELVWPSIIDNELALDLANSFLIVASPAESESLAPSTTLAWHFTTDRRKEFCKIAKFVQVEANQVEVRYKRLDPNAANPVSGSVLQHYLPERAVYRKGRVLSHKLMRVVTRDGWRIEEVCALLRDWLCFLSTLAAEKSQTVDLASPSFQLPGIYFDCIPQNIIVSDDGNFHFIDAEWTANENLDVGYIIFRSLLVFLNTVTAYGRPTHDIDNTFYGFVLSILDELGFSISKEVMDRYLALESRVQTEVSGRFINPQDVIVWLKNTVLPMNNLSQALVERDGQIANLNQSVVERDLRISDLNAQLAEIFNSKSWLLTEPFRNIRRKLRARPSIVIRKQLADCARRVWRGIPLSIHGKQKLKNLIFSALSPLFRHTQPYRTWKDSRQFVNGYSGLNSVQDANLLCESENQYVPILNSSPLKSKPVKLICFYLPQFHSIPENDAWWGEGFTEWTNVQPAQPQFVGHHQPHVPGELGYYNLLDSNVQYRQVELAKLYGIEGFCFYFYWFGGQRLLEDPIQNYLKDSKLDLQFCLCWANENWCRRWDGLDSEILIAQKHSEADDLAFIQHVAQYMRDPRYIRIDGKPLLLIYRPGLLPSALETSKRWRKWCFENGIGEVYLAYTQSFEAVDPAKYGFDAAIEFPPNNSAPSNITGSVTPIGEDFGSTVYDWRIFVKRSERYSRPDYKLFRSVCPSWDNTPRRKKSGTIFLNNTPREYKRWLENAIAETKKQHSNSEERLIFVNAWNEWAEGAHLEPDARYGYAWLQATRNALSGETFVPDRRRRVVLVAHDAHPHGAQLLALNLAKTLSKGMGFHVDLVCLGDGVLKSDYSKYATLHDLTGLNPRGPEAVALAKRLYGLGQRAALVNTTVSGSFLETLAQQGFRCVALIHELRGVLDQNKLHEQAKAIATHAQKIVFPAEEVASAFAEVAKMLPEKVVIRPQGLYKRRKKTANREMDRSELRQNLGLPMNCQILLGVGYADHRKGVDLFVDAGLKMASRCPDARWVWIGHWDTVMQKTLDKLLGKHESLKEIFIFPGLQADTDIYYGGADIFALTSREDPFPSVVLEALDASLPVVAFEGAGGFVSLLAEGSGKLVPKEDSGAFADAVAYLLESSAGRDFLGQQGLVQISERFSFRHYVFDLLKLLGIDLLRISAIVPNYNYARYLPERLGSILGQDYPIYEVIFLDDCSTDSSVDVARDILESSEIDFKIVVNDENSGSVFRQWKKGVDLALGTHAWLAEADDSCSHGLVSELINGFRTPGVVLSYCESQQINETGGVLANNYMAYVSDVDARHWLSPFIMDGNSEISNSLSIKNTIPNVSAVLFDKDVLTRVIKNHFELIDSYRIAGDWLTYVLVLNEGRLAFSSRPLNKHRRHSSGMTISNINQSQLEEIRRMQEYIAERHSVPAEKIERARRYIDLLRVEHGVFVH